MNDLEQLRRRRAELDAEIGRCERAQVDAQNERLEALSDAVFRFGEQLREQQKRTATAELVSATVPVDITDDGITINGTVTVKVEESSTDRTGFLVVSDTTGMNCRFEADALPTEAGLLGLITGQLQAEVEADATR
ncbi:hypothetical protein [Amycolatopsis sp. cmx-4-61]|uniref:hypothetical protein n=1 Tax=Amycolatopsis sp. cmx-4-61 TaxID=2790937 RepID=UPI00397CE73B